MLCFRRFLILGFVSIALVACQAVSPSVPTCSNGSALKYLAVFEYADFGPDVTATELLGQSWYQWLASGGSNPETTYDVKAVVHARGAVDLAKETYPVNETAQQDYRYVSYDDALAYIVQTQKDFAEATQNGVDMRAGQAKLEATRMDIIANICPAL